MRGSLLKRARRPTLLSHGQYRVLRNVFVQLAALYLLAHLEVCLLTLSSRRLSFKFFVLFYFYVVLFILYRVGFLDVGVDAQQPGAAVIPWERMASELDSRGHARPGTHFRDTDTHN